MSVEDLRPGMQLALPVHNKEGHTLLGPTVELTAAFIARLQDLGYWAVWVDDEETRDIVYEPMLSEPTQMGAVAAIRDLFALVAREMRTIRAMTANMHAALASVRFQQRFWDHPAIEKLKAQATIVVSELVDNPTLAGVHSIRNYDAYQYYHALDVAIEAVMLARRLDYDVETLTKLAIGCMLHDIGQLFVDETILNKPAHLSVEELAKMQEHATLGAAFIRSCLRLGAIPAEIANQHHERHDGSGYPRGLTGTNVLTARRDINPPGRVTPPGEIAAIADFHDACSSNQVYRKGFPPDRSWRMLKIRGGSHFNRELLSLLLEILPPFPLGTQVIVAEGDWEQCCGVVARLGDVMHRPVVRLLWDKEGARMKPVELDTSVERVRIRGAMRHGERENLAADERLGESFTLI
jgi:HD-GYP domain-containing protein (c-di-GMP phosphodiesterase class II)